MQHKKKLGIIGGMGSRAGVTLLKKVIDYSPALKDQDFLEIIFHNNSATPDRTRAIVYNEPSPLKDIYRSLELFNSNQVEVVAIACMTCHYYYEQITSFATSKVLNPLHLIVEAINEEYSGVRRVGLLATTGSINAGLYHHALHACNVEIVTLDPEKQELLFMTAVYMENGFKSAIIGPEAQELMHQSIEQLYRQGVDLVIGGCTEVSIGIDPHAVHTPYIDALDLLARKTVAYCYELESTPKGLPIPSFIA